MDISVSTVFADISDMKLRIIRHFEKFGKTLDCFDENGGQTPKNLIITLGIQ